MLQLWLASWKCGFIHLVASLLPLCVRLPWSARTTIITERKEGTGVEVDAYKSTSEWAFVGAFVQTGAGPSAFELKAWGKHYHFFWNSWSNVYFCTGVRKKKKSTNMQMTNHLSFCSPDLQFNPGLLLCCVPLANTCLIPNGNCQKGCWTKWETDPIKRFASLLCLTAVWQRFRPTCQICLLVYVAASKYYPRTLISLYSVEARWHWHKAKHSLTASFFQLHFWSSSCQFVCACVCVWFDFSVSYYWYLLFFFPFQMLSSSTSRQEARKMKMAIKRAALQTPYCLVFASVWVSTKYSNPLRRL